MTRKASGLKSAALIIPEGSLVALTL